MKNLDSEWFDSVVKEHGSVEKYVSHMISGGAEPLLFGIKPFEYLVEKGLFKIGDIIRTNLQGNSVDGHYEITPEIKLKGVEAAGGLYSGIKGVHDYKEILNLENSDNGWNLPFFAKSRIMIEARKNVNKDSED